MMQPIESPPPLFVDVFWAVIVTPVETCWVTVEVDAPIVQKCAAETTIGRLAAMRNASDQDGERSMRPPMRKAPAEAGPVGHVRRP